MIDNTQLAALVASKICHDLVEPMNAIIQGHEMIKSDNQSKPDPDALSLLDQGVAKAWAKLDFFRFALGGAASEGESSLDEAKPVAEKLYSVLKPELAWSAPPIQMSRQAVRALVNLLLIANECLPRGGKVEVMGEAGPNGGEVRIAASGARAALRTPTAQALRGETPEGGLTGYTVLQMLTGALARSNGIELLVRESEERVELVAKSASFKL
jgi:histidine phosphotransferase ChpT